MPLDEVGRRYADSIYQRRLHEISGNEEQEINQLRNQHAAPACMLIAKLVDFLFFVTGNLVETTLVNAICVSSAYFIKRHDVRYSTSTRIRKPIDARSE